MKNKPNSTIHHGSFQIVLFCAFLSLFFFSCRSEECEKNRKIRIAAMEAALSQSYSDSVAVHEYAEKSIDAIIDKFGCESLKKPNLLPDQQKELIKEVEEDNKELIERLEKSHR
jgi:c-di-AMP phosphodiesterase-like protein